MKVLQTSSLKKIDISQDDQKRSIVSTEFALVAETEADNIFLAFLNGPFANISAHDPDVRNHNFKARKKLYVSASSGPYYLDKNSVLPRLISLLPWSRNKQN